MQIMLKCRDRYGSVSFPAESLDGVAIPERQYAIANNTVILAGRPDFVLHRDCDTLLAMPDGLYRMPTPAEQDAAVQVLQAAVSVQEAVSVADVEPEQQPPALLDKIKKAVGG